MKEHQSEIAYKIPIVDEAGNIVGWTRESPTIQAGRVRHDAAAALLKGELSATFIELNDRGLARQAGAPAGWNGPWRCMAICPAGLATKQRRLDPAPAAVRMTAV